MNFQTTLNNSIQTINNASDIAVNQKKEFSALIEELRKNLEPAASKKPEETENVAQFVECCFRSFERKAKQINHKVID